MKGFFNTTHTNNARFETKQDKKPDGENELINKDTGKLDAIYLPKGIGQGLKFAGTFDADGVITASAYAPELQGRGILGINLTECVGYEFQYTGDEPFVLRGLEINKNDIIVCNGDEEPNWTLIDNSDKVVSVNGQTGAVVINSIQSDDGGVNIARISSENGEILLEVYPTSGGSSNKQSIKIDGDGIEIEAKGKMLINGKPIADVESLVNDINALLDGINGEVV